jgi:hypothetical protein
VPGGCVRDEAEQHVFVIFAAGDADDAAPCDVWWRGGQVTALPGRSNGFELRHGTYHRAVGARRREPCCLPAGATEGGPHVADQTRKQLYGKSLLLWCA